MARASGARTRPMVLPIRLRKRSRHNEIIQCDEDNPGTAIVDPTVTHGSDDLSRRLTYVDAMGHGYICQAGRQVQRLRSREHARTRSTSSNKAQYDAENPMLDLDGERVTDNPDPRSRVYLELSEDLASDAEPTVLVVGGAVFDLASNTNPARTLSDEVRRTGSRRASRCR